MSQYKENVKYRPEEIPEIDTGSPAHKFKNFTKSIFDPDSLEAKSDKVLNSIGDPRDERTYGIRMRDEMLSILQSKTANHNALRYEVDYGGKGTQFFQKHSKRGQKIVRIIDKEPKDIEKELEMFEMMDANVGLSPKQQEKVEELKQIISDSERIFVKRGKNHVLLRAAPAIDHLTVTDNEQGGVPQKQDMEDVHPNIRTYFFKEIEKYELQAKQRMVDEICYETHLDQSLFYKGLYTSPFDGETKPRFNNELIDKFIKEEDRVDSDYELTRIIDPQGNIIEMPETEEEIQKGLECEQEVERLLGGEPPRIINRQFANYGSIPPFIGKTEDDKHLTATMSYGVDMWINGRSVGTRDFDYAMEQITRTGDFEKGFTHKTGRFALKQGVRGASFRLAGYPVEMAEKALKNPSKDVQQGDSIVASLLQQVFNVMGRGVQTR